MATIKGITTAAVLVGGLTLGAAGATLTGHTRTASAAAAPARPTAASHARGGRATRRALRRRLLRRRLGVVLMVKGVSGTTIDAAHGAQAITVTVGSSTAYREAGQTVQLSAVQPGERIAVKGSRSGRDALQATMVRIILPHEAGVVTGVAGTTITVTGLNGATHTIDTAGATFTRAGQVARSTDVTTGTAIVAVGTRTSDGSLSAKEVVIRLPRVTGHITSVNGSSYTIANARGVAHTVVTTSSTVYTSRGTATASASSLATGTRIVAQGALSPDGKTLTAVRIVVR